jgi:hypothetical protein
MSASKCQYILFAKDPKAKNFSVNLHLMNEKIPKVENVKLRLPYEL